MSNLREVWLPISGFPEYHVSNLGNIKSVKTAKILAPYQRWIERNGKRRKKACTVVLQRVKQKQTFTVHYLVLNTFRPNTSDKKLNIDHIDRDPFNNALNNLRWATGKQQADNRKPVRTKTILKLTAADLDVAYRRTRGEFLSDIAKDYNLTKSDLHKLLIYMHPLY